MKDYHSIPDRLVVLMSGEGSLDVYWLDDVRKVALYCPLSLLEEGVP